jgi:hypothetical protein
VILPAHYEGFSKLDFSGISLSLHGGRSFFWSTFSGRGFMPLLRLRSEGIGHLADIREAMSENRIVDVEAVVVVALLGLGPGLITHLDGGSAFYFSDVQRWLAVGFLLSRIPELSSVLFGEQAPVRRTLQRKTRLLERFDAIPCSFDAGWLSSNSSRWLDDFEYSRLADEHGSREFRDEARAISGIRRISDSAGTSRSAPAGRS